MAVSPAGDYYPPGHPLGPTLTWANNLPSLVPEAPSMECPQPSLADTIESAEIELSKVRDSLVFLRRLVCTDRRPYVGFDFDGTLAHWVEGQQELGAPIPANVQRAKYLYKSGVLIKIITARLSPKNLSHETIAKLVQTEIDIENWCYKHLGFYPHEITCVKKHGLIKLYDDRAVGIVVNTGEIRRRDEIMKHHCPSGGPQVVAPDLSGYMFDDTVPIIDTEQAKKYLHEHVSFDEIDRLALALLFNDPRRAYANANHAWQSATDDDREKYRGLALRAMVFFAERVSKASA